MKDNVRGDYVYIGDHVGEFRTITGSCKPSGYPEYDELTGYVTDHYTREWVDNSGMRWRKVTTVINLGRPDRGVPVDPDAAMEPDKLEKYYDCDAAVRAHQQMANGRHRVIQEIIIAHLRDRGPMLVRDIAKLLQMQKEWTRLHLLRFEGSAYVRLPLNKHRDLWGVAGVHDGKL